VSQTKEAPFVTRNQPDDLGQIVRRMGQPSWLILGVLESHRGLAGIQIIDRVEAVLADAAFPHRTLDPSTLHLSLKRMITDGLVRSDGRRTVDVPTAFGRTHPAEREVFVITSKGMHALDHYEQLQKALARARQRIRAKAPAAI
jgi:hypothetical protein